MYQDWMEKIPVIEDIEKIRGIMYMCEYCEDIVNKPIRSVNWGGSGQMNITKTGNLYGKDDEVFIINYCPMCGRKLGEEDK